MTENSPLSSRILNVAFRLLSRKIYTVENFKKKLKTRFSKSENEILAVIDMLKDKNYLNDETFCEEYIHYRLHSSAQGEKKLMYELIKKGISKDLARKAVDEASINEHEIAQNLASQKLQTLQGLPKEKQKIRLIRFLYSRGIKGNVVMDVAKSYFS